ncbi:MAG: amino acid ABC transporter permease [Candidatus Methylomirabilales bacterium]
MESQPIVVQYAYFFLKAAAITLGISFLSLFVGSIIGFLFSLLRISRNRVFSALTFAYAEVFRGTPLLVQLFLVYFGLPIVFHLEVSAFTTVAVSMTLYTAGYMTEIFRAAIQAVDRGQWDAAYSIGMTYPQALFKVVLPQAMRIALPPTLGQFISILKDSSLASIIGFMELTKAGMAVRAATSNTMLAFAIVTCLYFMICYSLSIASRRVELQLKKA